MSEMVTWASMMNELHLPNYEIFGRSTGLRLFFDDGLQVEQVVANTCFDFE